MCVPKGVRLRKANMLTQRPTREILEVSPVIDVLQSSFKLKNSSLESLISAIFPISWLPTKVFLENNVQNLLIGADFPV